MIELQTNRVVMHILNRNTYGFYQSKFVDMMCYVTLQTGCPSNEVGTSETLIFFVILPSISITSLGRSNRSGNVDVVCLRLPSKLSKVFKCLGQGNSKKGLEISGSLESEKGSAASRWK